LHNQSAKYRDSIEKRNIDIVNLLLDAGADPNLRFYNSVRASSQGTHLGLAVVMNASDIVEALLKAGADPQVHIVGGSSLLDLANRLKFDEVAKLLIDAGAQSSMHEAL